MIAAFVHNPVKVAVGVLLVALFGTVSLLNMPKQLTPEVTRPVVSIETRWPGASPQEVEREIVQLQEEQLQSVEGVTKMTSMCGDSNASITLEFAVGTNMNEALLKINSNLQQVRDYPIDAREPTIRTSNSSDSPIARYFLSPIPPGPEEVQKVQQAHPELNEPLAGVLRAANPGLALLRLRRLVEQHGETYPLVKELLPSEVNLPQLYRFVEDNVAPRLERVPGVADASVYGGVEEELQVVVDPEKLAARNLTIADVRDALRGQNKDTSGGDFWEGKRRWVVRVLGQYQSEEEVRQQLLAVRDGAPVYIGEVADVRLGYKKPDSFSRRYGVKSVGISIQRQSEANVLEVMEGLGTAAREINETILYPRGLQLFMQYDETEYIHSAISLVQQNIFIGGALTMIVLMLFLNSGRLALVSTPFIAASAVSAAYVSPWLFVVTLAIIAVVGLRSARPALVVGLAIPTSLIGTFLMMRLFERSLNVISLAGLAFAVGMLVDNAVVVLENIFRRHELGETPFDAAVRGTQEVWGAVVASTLTTVAVFLPVLFVEDVAGQLFQDISLAISCAVALSMVVSFTFIPVLSARLLRVTNSVAGLRSVGQAAPGRPVPAGGAAISGREGEALGVHSRLTTFTKSALWGINAWFLRRTWRSLALIVVTLVGTYWLTVVFWPQVDYLPTGNRNMIVGTFSFPPGYNIDQMMEIGDFVDDKLQPYWDTDPGTPEAAKLDAPLISDYFFVMRRGSIFLGVRAHDGSRVNEFIPIVRQMGEMIPGTRVRAAPTSLFERGFTSARSIDVEIAGPDLGRLVELGRRIMAEVQQRMPEAQALPQPSLDLSSPELHVEPKPMQLSEMGFDTTELGYTVDSLIDGAYAGDYFSGGDKVDLTIMGTDGRVSRTQDLDGLSVATPAGQVVPLAALADVSFSSGPEQIMRRERQRAITISVAPPADVPLEEAMSVITQQIVRPLQDSGALEGGYSIFLSGSADQLRQSWDSLKWSVMLALAITYLLMAALFESWLYPLVIIVSVPLGAVGGLLGLWILNLFTFQPLDVLTMLGFVILIGTVVNNPILIVHQALNHMRYDGMHWREAILESVRNRMRPIFITTGTTVLGLLPLVLFPGAGSELYRGLGSVMLGGLIVSTLFTLVLTPVIFAVALQIREELLQLLFGHGVQREEALQDSGPEHARGEKPDWNGSVGLAAEAAEAPAEMPEDVLVT
jgi:HAE1 family hydrophobic/amphiphilic exporter-1